MQSSRAAQPPWRPERQRGVNSRGFYRRRCKRKRQRPESGSTVWLGRQIYGFRQVCPSHLYIKGNAYWTGRFLHHIHTHTDDKIVLISNYTQTLDLFEKLCRSKKWVCFFQGKDSLLIFKKIWFFPTRWDNDYQQAPEISWPIQRSCWERIHLPSEQQSGWLRYKSHWSQPTYSIWPRYLLWPGFPSFCMLIYVRQDWNPAADQQALARVWRDGQKKECAPRSSIYHPSFPERQLLFQALFIDLFRLAP